MKKSILSIAVVAAMIVGCKKNDDNNVARKDMIVGTWNLSQWGIDANSNQTLDQGETAPASTLGMNSTFTFNSNGTAMVISSGLGASDTTNGEWALVDNDNYIRTISDNDTTFALIKSISSNSITLLDTAEASMNLGTWVVLTK